MQKKMAAAAVFALWVACMQKSAHALLPTSQSQLPFFQKSFCDYSPATSTRYNVFTDPLNMAQVNFDAVKGWNLTTVEHCDPESSVGVQGCAWQYSLEARRGYKLGAQDFCQTCPYHWDLKWKDMDPYTGLTQLANLFGPCFNKEASMQTICSQHPALAPMGFVGIYHYPMQMPFTQAVWNQSMLQVDIPQPMHMYFMGQASSDPYQSANGTNPKNPSQFGLGKEAVQMWMETVRLINKTTGLENKALTNTFMQPYKTINGVEQWLKWAQFFCVPACHRDSRYTQVKVLPSDIEGKPEHYYLTAYLNDPTSNVLTRCARCPERFASYEWDDIRDAPYHPRVNIFATQCYPWFGSLPSIVYTPSTGHLLNYHTIKHTALEGILFPEEEYVVTEVVCPVNTYNRVCAHAKRWYYAENRMADYQCTPCPDGYHTDGRTGQWYCQPPPGNLFTFKPLSTIPRVWANRDLLSRVKGWGNFPELECGYLPEHCIQQPECGPEGMLPSKFNEDYVFSKLLDTRPCAVGFYCPDAFTESACPTERPWSPPGSASLANCSCRRGQYLSAAQGGCALCTTECTLPGTYLPYSQCMGKDGATKDAPCLQCTNLPPSLSLIHI